ncbi:MAG: 4-hydroxy-tetrahydrodipicolinate reductase [bacterium]
MLNIIVCGALGRMGKEITLKVSQTKGMKLIGAIEAPHHPSLGKEIEKGIRVIPDLEKAIGPDAVIIDFTTPQATLEHLAVAKSRKVPMVIGTTGFKDNQYEKIKEASRSIPLVLSPNMSVGINLFYKMIEEAASVLGEDFDAEIIETHHRKKADAPSGTAKKIAQIIARTKNTDLAKTGVYGRKGARIRSPDEIGIHAVRGGSVIGDHMVLFAGPGERLEIIHRAESRGIFAQGAILAAKFIVGKDAGLYDLQDVLGLRKGRL